jgi:hypothetical protein
MPRYEIRNTSNSALTYVEGDLPLDLMLTQAAGTYRARAMSAEEATNIVVPTLTAGTIVQTTPDIGDTLTVTGSNAPTGATFLWQVDTGGGFGAAGGTNNAATYDTTGRPAGDYRRGVSTAGQSMVYTPAVAVGAAVSGATLLAQTVSAMNLGNHTFDVSATAGNTVVITINWVNAERIVTGVVVDPGGPNEQIATIRHTRLESSNGVAIADVEWPVTGSHTVRITLDQPVAGIGLTAASVGTKTYVTGIGNGSGGANPETHTESLNTTAGDTVIMALTLGPNEQIEFVAGVDAQLGTNLNPLASARTGYVVKKDSVVGGNPEVFTVRWPLSAWTSSVAALGVYR